MNPSMTIDVDSNELDFDTAQERMDFIGELMDGLASAEIETILHSTGYEPPPDVEEDTFHEDTVARIYALFFDPDVRINNIFGNMIEVKIILSEWLKEKRK